ncbi:hypothetical protein T01_16236 [Trichinella spiralis]|uniref:Shavenoid isoform B-like N-terminal domain-containing protein n=1 Tax=Trichinella spiralis TaxID=6334 RepID=A0A0V1BI18_TRISP|nr:hypothetical protein T01_16236 [Trichinella spiralis]
MQLLLWRRAGKSVVATVKSPRRVDVDDDNFAMLTTARYRSSYAFAQLFTWILWSCAVSQGSANRLVHNITRIFNTGDIFNNPDVTCKPQHCSVYNAISSRNSGCSCQCPLNYPAFLQHVKKCSDSIDDCRMLHFGIYGQSSERIKIPTVYLPLTGQILNPSLPPDWKAVGLKPDADQNVPCVVSSVGYLTHSGWIPLENVALFALLNSNGNNYIQWLGNKQDQLFLTGKIVEISLQCQEADSPDLCAVFRVIGRDVEAAEPAVANNQKETAERTNQLGLVVGIVCGVILTLFLLVISVFWTICWKQQKDRLAKKIQLHVLLQQQLLQEQQNSGMIRHFPRAYRDGIVQPDIDLYQNYRSSNNYSPYSTDGRCWNTGKMRPGGVAYSPQRHKLYGKGAGNGGGEPLPPPPPYSQNRKRLYFSPEFFEPEKMVNPPPNAEEFLSEVRHMISQAQSRIKGRRYTPSLLVIPEEERSIAAESRASSTTDEKQSVGRLDCAQSTSAGQATESQTSDSAVSTAASSSAPCQTLPMEYQAKCPSEPGSLAEKPSQEGACSYVPEKVAQWLNRHGETGGYLENDSHQPPPLPMAAASLGRHSNLYKYFNARQQAARWMCVDEPEEGHPLRDRSISWTAPKPAEPSYAPGEAAGSNQAGFYKRRASCPTLTDENPIWSYAVAPADFRVRPRTDADPSVQQYAEDAFPRRPPYATMDGVCYPVTADVFNRLPYAQSLPRGKRPIRPRLHAFFVDAAPAETNNQKVANPDQDLSTDPPHQH